MAALVQQALQLLDRAQMTLERQKDNAMHLMTVFNDVKGTMSIVERIQSNPQLEDEHMQPLIEELLRIATDLSNLVSEQEEKAKNNGGFREFTHDFLKGPKDQRRLEALRNDLVASKNTLTLGIITYLAPAGTSLKVDDVKMTGLALQHNGRVIRGEGDQGQDFDHITVKGVEMGGAAVMMNATVNESQQNKLIKNQVRNYRIQQLAEIMRDGSVDKGLQRGAFEAMTALFGEE